MPFKAMLRALVLIPFIVPTVLSALAFWWILRFPILDHLMVAEAHGLITQNINFLGDTTWARVCVIFANIWRGVPFLRSRCWPACRPCSPRCMKPRPWTAPAGGSCFVTSPIRC